MASEFEFFLVTHVYRWDLGVRVDGIIGLGTRQTSDTSQPSTTLLDSLH